MLSFFVRGNLTALSYTQNVTLHLAWRVITSHHNIASQHKKDVGNTKLSTTNCLNFGISYKIGHVLKFSTFRIIYLIFQQMHLICTFYSQPLCECYVDLPNFNFSTCWWINICLLLRFIFARSSKTVSLRSHTACLLVLLKHTVILILYYTALRIIWKAECWSAIDRTSTKPQWCWENEGHIKKWRFMPRLNIFKKKNLLNCIWKQLSRILCNEGWTTIHLHKREQQPSNSSLVYRKGEVKKATGNSCSPLIMRIQMRRMHLSIVHM